MAEFVGIGQSWTNRSFFVRDEEAAGSNGGIIAVLFGGCALFIWLAFPDPCANDNIVETGSLNGQLKAVSFRGNCGATTSYSTHFSILPASRKLPNDSGNVFVATREPSITVRWIDDRHLSIGGEMQTEFLHLVEWTSAQHLRHCRFIAMRGDKPRAVVRET